MKELLLALFIGLAIGWSGLVPELVRKNLDRAGTAALLLMIFAMGIRFAKLHWAAAQWWRMGFMGGLMALAAVGGSLLLVLLFFRQGGGER